MSRIFDREVFLLAVALGLDSFSLAVGMGCSKLTKNLKYIFVLLVGFFHIVFPIAGMIIGWGLGRFLSQFAQYLGASILVLLGLKTLQQAYRGEELNLAIINLSSILLLTLSVSVDALAAGFSLGTLGYNAVAVALIIGFAAVVLTLFGFFIGYRVDDKVSYSAYLAGLMLLFLGIRSFF